MKLSTGALMSELIGALFGWVWIFAFFAIPVSVIWAIFGTGEWYYPVIAFLVGSFCKALCREYKKQSESMLYESTGKDYATEWIALPYDDKKQAVISSFKEIFNKYHPNATNIQDWISYYEENNRFDEIVHEITERYRETDLKRPYQVVCQTFMESYFLSLAGEKN